MKPHPRLFLSEQEFTDLKTQVRNDAVSRRLFACLRRKADDFLDAPVCRHEKTGKRLLAVSRSALERVMHLAMVARLTDDARYARRAAQEMLACAAFPDWNPSHFLDTAEMTFALAVGYDWLRDQLSVAERDTIADAIVEKGLRPSLDEDQTHCQWIKGGNNWNQVCHAGMTVGALVLAERDPEMADRIVARAIANVPVAAKAYAPDGAYAEGPMYWDYGTSFHVALIAALESSLDHDGGLADGPGFLDSARYLAQATGPGGLFFNYSDCRATRSLQPALAWFARRLDEPGLVKSEWDRLDEHLSDYEASPPRDDYRMLALALAWRRPGDDAGRSASLPLHWMGRGVTPIGVHRSAWGDPRASYVALKGGSPSAPHAHMDAGVFVLEMGGVRWAVDLGMQEYESLERLGIDLWNNRPGSQRWDVFRIGNQGHSVPIFNGAPQLISGYAPIVRFRADGDMPHTVVDLSSIYSDQVTRAWRGVGLLPDGRVILQDEWTAGDAPVEMRWQMFTTATAEATGNVVTLSQGDAQLHLRIEEPEDGTVVEIIEKSEPTQSFDAPNPGLRLIAVTVHTPPGGSCTLRVSAALTTTAEAVLPTCLPLEHWSEKK